MLLHDVAGGCWVKPGQTHGATDPITVYNLQASILHLLGVDHLRLTYRFQGRDFRLTDIHGAVVKGVLG